ncbi:hypothetical protein Pelo_6528 [Pelomyxa schiedti]|nr:hypothetical protein Pelo_6528 [Pelomyxa schiedti]
MKVVYTIPNSGYLTVFSLPLKKGGKMTKLHDSCRYVSKEGDNLIGLDFDCHDIFRFQPHVFVCKLIGPHPLLRRGLIVNVFPCTTTTGAMLRTVNDTQTGLTLCRCQMSALAMVPALGAAVARIVWEHLVSCTPATFVLRVEGESPPRESVCVCLRVSPLLGGLMPPPATAATAIMGASRASVGAAVELRASGRDTGHWVDDRWYLTNEYIHVDSGAGGAGGGRTSCQFAKWQLVDAAASQSCETVGVVGCDPMNFLGRTSVANHKWVVTCGWFSTESGIASQATPMLLTRRLNPGSFLGSEAHRVVAVPPAVLTSLENIRVMRFSKSRADELLLFLSQPGEESMPSFVMVDVEATHSTGSLVLTSITHVVDPPSDCVPAAFLLKRTDGSHTLVVSAPHWIFGPEMNCCALEVEEGSGNARTAKFPSWTTAAKTTHNHGHS